MKTRPEIEVFDDAEYCHNQRRQCAYFDDDRDECQAYRGNDGKPVSLDDEEWTFPHFYYRAIKCNQCKADYQTALKKQPIKPEILFEGT